MLHSINSPEMNSLQRRYVYKDRNRNGLEFREEPAEQTIRIMVIDNHPFVLDSIGDYLDKVEEFQVVCKLNDGAKVLSAIEQYRPNVIVMDPFLKRDKGINLAKKIKENYQDSLKIIIFTNFSCVELVKLSVNMGINAFLLKNEPFEKVINAVRQCYLGNVLYSDHLLIAEGSPCYLTMTEIEILKLISEEKSNQEIAKELHISKRTVEYHITSIFQKFGVHSRVGAVMKGIEKGLLYL